MKKMNTLSRATIYVHRNHEMREKGRLKFFKHERIRIEIKLKNKEKADFIYADELQKYLAENFEYGTKLEKEEKKDE